MSADPTKRLVAVRLDEATIARSTPDIEHERRVAIFDLVEDNVFGLDGHEGGPYELDLTIVENRLVFQIGAAGTSVMTHVLSLSPFRRIVKDYWMICESYYAAIRTATPSQIETIDMARRGLHNEGSTILVERLTGKITVDFDTARRLFTLICVLHWKG
jgi:uncharacterized protein (UPF0262 family)